jgi:hypothetical protein
MNFKGVKKKCGKFSKVHYLLVIHYFEFFFIFGRLIMIVLNK